MILYHGSNRIVTNPDVFHSRSNVDFGKGFYTTLLYEQAVKWCGKFQRVGQKGIVSRYSVEDSVLAGEDVIVFDGYTEEWLDFISNCKMGKDDTTYKIAIGGIANDKVFNTIELYFDHLIDKEEAIKRLRYEKPNLQVCFRSQEVIDCYLKYEGYEEI